MPLRHTEKLLFQSIIFHLRRKRSSHVVSQGYAVVIFTQKLVKSLYDSIKLLSNFILTPPTRRDSPQSNILCFSRLADGRAKVHGAQYSFQVRSRL
jgi:hypothetical protein